LAQESRLEPQLRKSVGCTRHPPLARRVIAAGRPDREQRRRVEAPQQMGVVAENLLTDRLVEFRRLARYKGHLLPDVGGPAAVEVGGPPGSEKPRTVKARLLQPGDPAPLPVSGRGGRSSFMRDFFEALAEVQGALRKGRDGVQAMSDVLVEALQATTREREGKASERLQSLVAEVGGQLAEAKAGLETMKAKSDSEKSPNSAQCRIKRNLQQAAAQKYQQLLLDFSRAQVEFKEMLQKRETREMQLLCPEASEVELQQMMEAGETSSQLVVRRMAGTHAALLDEVQRIRDKHQDILRLEQGVHDLAQMFEEVAILVDAQGELLDNIEGQVRGTKEYTAKGVQELVKTTKIQRNTRKWMCCFSVFMMLVLIAILYPVLFRS